MARLADIPMQTVSRVATSSDRVHPDIRTEVLRVMNKLGYSPSHAAQALRRGSFKAVDVLAQQIQRTGEALTTTGMLGAATAVDYAINLVWAEHPISGDLRQAVYRLSHQATDGPVVVWVGRAGREHLVPPPSIPVAVSDSTLVDHYPSANADQVGGVCGAIGHPLGLGHRNVQHVCGPGDSQSSLIRRATWTKCLRKAGLPVPGPIPDNQEAVTGYAVGRLLTAGPEMTAVFYANDEPALGLIQATREQGRWVPGDVSVVGFDGFDVGEYSFPPLATVHQGFRRRGHEMVGLMLEQVTSGVRDGSRNIIIPTELILRGSTTPPSAT